MAPSLESQDRAWEWSLGAGARPGGKAKCLDLPRAGAWFGFRFHPFSGPSMAQRLDGWAEPDRPGWRMPGWAGGREWAVGLQPNSSLDCSWASPGHWDHPGVQIHTSAFSLSHAQSPIHTCKDTHICLCTLTSTLMHMHSHNNAVTPTFIHTHPHSCTHMHMPSSYTPPLTHTYPGTRAHARTHTHTHTRLCSCHSRSGSCTHTLTSPDQTDASPGAHSLAHFLPLS